MTTIAPLNKSVTDWLYLNPERKEVTHCPLCEQTANFSALSDVPKLAGMQLVMCQHCGFVTYNPQPLDISKYYSECVRQQSLEFIHTKHSKLVYHKNLIGKFAKENELYFESVLDYGSSDGYLLDYLSETNRTSHDGCVGVEVNKGHANWAKMIKGFDVRQDADLSQFESEQFQLIVLYHVLEHIQSPKRFLQEVISKIALGGYLYLALPTMNRIDYDLPFPMQGKGGTIFFKDEHINLFTDETLARLLESCGLEIQFSDHVLYGTCYIAKKTRNVDLPLDNTGLYEKAVATYRTMMECYALKLQMDEAATHDIPKALLLGKQAILRQPLFPQLVQKVAALHIDFIEQQDLFSEYLALYPNEIKIWLSYGMVCFQEQDFAKAKEIFLSIMERWGNIDNATIQLFHIAYFEKDFESLKKYMQLLMKDGGESDPYKISLIGSVLTQL